MQNSSEYVKSREQAFNDFVADFRKKLRTGLVESLDVYVRDSPNKLLARRVADMYLHNLPPIDKSVEFDYLQTNHLISVMEKGMSMEKEGGEQMSKIIDKHILDNLMELGKLTLGHDNVCPVTKLQCDDECCMPGSECNLAGSDLSPISGFQSKCPITSKDNGQA
jgi:hypothetical protein